MRTLTEIKADVHFLASAEGGRTARIFSGYRPTFFWDGCEALGGNDGQLTLDGRDECNPGEDSIIRILFSQPELLPRTIRHGTTFTLREGGRIIGRGRVLQVLNPLDSEQAPLKSASI